MPSLALNSNRIKLGLCSRHDLMLCPDIPFTEETIDAVFFNISIDSSSTYFTENTTAITT